jgi:hypothetical protein
LWDWGRVCHQLLAARAPPPDLWAAKIGVLFNLMALHDEPRASIVRARELLMKKNWFGAQYVSTYEQFKKHFHCSPVNFVSAARNCFCIWQPSALMDVLLVNLGYRNFMQCYSLQRCVRIQNMQSLFIQHL